VKHMTTVLNEVTGRHVRLAPSFDYETPEQAAGFTARCQEYFKAAYLLSLDDPAELRAGVMWKGDARLGPAEPPSLECPSCGLSWPDVDGGVLPRHGANGLRDVAAPACPGSGVTVKGEHQ
jgi:hypothetical protein